ncbi:hypothetical protein AN641_02970 [Candidatus Epulonipiscioides gigas]|nr:hypothetical protein AN641_02970 [Epulopiscium sp. SCG-C07WGA-EpuloA2]
MKSLLGVEVLTLICIFFMSKIFILSPNQHIISIAVVFVVFLTFRALEKSKNKIIAFYLKKSKKMGIFFYSERYTKLIGYLPSVKKEMSLSVQMGIELCQLILQTVVIAIFLSQIVFIPMNIIENSISLTIGVIFYVLCCQSLFILPYMIFKEIKSKKISIAIK